MQTIALFRTNVTEDARLADVLRKCSFRVADIYDVRDIHIGQITSINGLDLVLRGIKMAEVDAFVYSGPPQVNSQVTGTSETETFRQAECSAALIAALHLVRMRVLNRGAVFCHARALLSPSFQRRTLHKIGWDIDEIASSYDFESGRESVKNLAGPAGIRRYLLLTQRRWLLQPSYPVISKVAQRFDALVARTQHYLRNKEIDWAIIPFREAAHSLIAEGIGQSFPNQVDDHAIGVILRDCIF